MRQETLAIAISIFSIVIAALSLGWNIFRDVILKPRLKVTISVSTFIGMGQPKIKKICVSVVNLGPGPIICEMVHVKLKSILPGTRRTPRFGVLLPDWEDPYNRSVPLKLEIGDSSDMRFPFKEDCFLKENLSRVGVKDSYGRIHWAPKKQLKRAKAEYITSFKNLKNA